MQKMGVGHRENEFVRIFIDKSNEPKKLWLYFSHIQNKKYNLYVVVLSLTLKSQVCVRAFHWKNIMFKFKINVSSYRYEKFMKIIVVMFFILGLGTSLLFFYNIFCVCLRD